MTVAERRIEVLSALERGLSIRQVARLLGVHLRTVVADRLALRRDGVVLPRPETLMRAIEGVGK